MMDLANFIIFQYTTSNFKKPNMFYVADKVGTEVNLSGKKPAPGPG